MADTKDLIVRLSMENGKFTSAVTEADGKLNKLGKTTEKTESAFSKLSKVAKGVGVFLAGSAIVKGIQALSNLAAKAEQTKVAFTTFLGSADKANKLMKQLNSFSRVTPFEPEQVNDAGKALLAFGIEQEKIIDTLRMVGDVSAATGKDFNELSVIYGKARTQGTLFAEDINQLTEAGIPIIDEFAKIMGVSTSEVKKLGSEGKITFPLLEQAFGNMTGEGGRFFGLMNEQSKTFAGRMSTLMGNLKAVGITIGTVINDIGGPFLDAMNSLLGSQESGVDIVNNLVSANSEYKSVLEELSNTLDKNTSAQDSNTGAKSAALVAKISSEVAKLNSRWAELPGEIEKGQDQIDKYGGFLERNRKFVASLGDDLRRLKLGEDLGPFKTIPQTEADIRRLTEVIKEQSAEVEKGSAKIASAEKEQADIINGLALIWNDLDDVVKASLNNQLADLVIANVDIAKENKRLEDEEIARAERKRQREKELAEKKIEDEKIFAEAEKLTSGIVQQTEEQKLQAKINALDEFAEKYADHIELLNGIDMFREELKTQLAEKEKQRNIADFEQGIQRAQSFAGTMQDMTKAVLDARIQAAEQGSEADKKSAIRAFNVNKATGITTTIIDTISSAQKAFKAMADIPYVGPILGAAAAAAASVAGGARVAQISQQQPPAFATGGIIADTLPSIQTPKGEDGLIAVQRGEAVLNKNAVTELGENTINALNGMGGSSTHNNFNMNVSGNGAVDTINDFLRTQGGSRGAGF